MEQYIQIPVDLISNLRTQRIRRRLGEMGVLCLIKLILWVVQYRTDGVLRNMDVESIEIVSGWRGQKGLLCKALCRAGWLKENSGEFTLLNWAESDGGDAHEEGLLGYVVL